MNLLVVSNNRAQQGRHSVVWYLINVRWFTCLTVMQPYQEHGLVLRFYLIYYLIFHNSVVLLPNGIRLEISLLVKSLAGEKANCSFSCSFCCFHFTVLLELHLFCLFLVLIYSDNFPSLILQCERGMWEGRYWHCLQAFQGILPNILKCRQEAECGLVSYSFNSIWDYYLFVWFMLWGKGRHNGYE